MRSIPLAMTWEMFSKGFWTLIGLSLAANALPALLLTALKIEGEIHGGEPIWAIMHLTMVQISVFTFGTGVSSAQGAPSRLFAMPISNSAIATWHLLPAMILVAAHSAGSNAVLNAVFGLNWPGWGPAMFMAVAFAGFQATCWFTEKSGWIFWGLLLYGSVFGLWFKSRYGETFSQPTHLWNEVTVGEVATMLGFFAMAHVVAVKGIARNRCGEPLPSFGIIAWIERLFDPAPDFGKAFRTPQESQFWVEWRRKGLAMPAGVVICLSLGISGWLIANRNPQDLLEGLLGGGGMLSILGAVGGLVMGHFGASNTSCDMGSFFATRPMTSSDFARCILKTAVKSVLLAWIIWAIATLAIYLLFQVTSAEPPRVPSQLGWWYLPATLLGLWITVSTGASIVLSGRAEAFVKLFVGLAMLFVAAPMVIRMAISPHAQGQFLQVAAAVLSVAILLGTAWAFVIARRRALIESSTVWIAASVWIVVSAAVIAELLRVSDRSLVGAVVVMGVGTLIVTPLATTPLAIVWNRNR